MTSFFSGLNGWLCGFSIMGFDLIWYFLVLLSCSNFFFVSQSSKALWCSHSFQISRLTADKERVRMLQEVRCMLQKTIQHEEKFRHLQESILHQETILLPVQEAVQHQQETLLQQHMEEMLKSGLEETDTVKSRLLVLIQQLSGQVITSVCFYYKYIIFF